MTYERLSRSALDEIAGTGIMRHRNERSGRAGRRRQAVARRTGHGKCATRIDRSILNGEQTVEYLARAAKDRCRGPRLDDNTGTCKCQFRLVGFRGGQRNRAA